MKSLSSTNQLSSDCIRCESLSKSVSDFQAVSETLREVHELMSEVSASVQPSISLVPSIDASALSLDLNELIRGQGPLKPLEAEHMRVLLLGINEKLKTLDLCQQKILEFRSKLKQLIYARETIHESIADTIAELQRESAEKDILVNELKEERNTSQMDLKKQQQLYQDKCNDEERLLSEFKLLSAEHEQLKSEHKNFQEMQELITSLRNQVAQGDNARTELRALYSQNMQDFLEKREELESENKQLSTENEVLGQQLKKATDVIKALENIRDTQTADLLQAEYTRKDLETRLTAANDMASKASDMEALATHHQEQSFLLNGKIQESTSAFALEIEKLNREKEGKLAELKISASKSMDLDRKVKDLSVQNDILQGNNFTLQEDLATIEEKLCMQEHAFHLVEQTQQAKQDREDFIQGAYKEFEFMSDFLIAQSEQNLSHSRLVQKLQKTMNDKNTEVSLLREMIMELQRYRDYQAVKDDPIDEALAQYLAHRATPLDVPFVREDKGIYLFGTRRVFMKLEVGKIILRVGGGFMHIDQFVDIYTPLEAEKLGLKRTGHEKKKSLAGKAINAIAHKQDVSPQKAARIVKDALSGGTSQYTTMYAVPRKATPKKSRKLNN